MTGNVFVIPYKFPLNTLSDGTKFMYIPCIVFKIFKI